MVAAQMRDRASRRRRHRHQWRRRLDRARRACARNPLHGALRRLRRVLERGACGGDRGHAAGGGRHHDFRIPEDDRRPMSRAVVSSKAFETKVPLLIVGAGAAGLCAALAAKEEGVEPILIERDAVPSGSTALSAGLIPAAGTRFQRAKGIADSPELFADDIQRKAHDEADPAVVEAVARGSAPLIEWLAGRYAFPFDVVDNFNYPGHSAMRMHGLPSRTGRELIDRLRGAAEANGIIILTR